MAPKQGHGRYIVKNGSRMFQEHRAIALGKGGNMWNTFLLTKQAAPV